jgi:hypothetical protein
MTEYYGYVRRNAKSQVDWGSISKGITEDISKISQDREKKRGDLDKMNQDLVRASNELDLTDNEHVNRLILDGADQMKQLALMNNKLLKGGILKPSDYSLAMENMKAGVSGLSKSIKEFGPAYKRDMERMAKGEIGFIEAHEKENLFKYGNLKDKTLYVNPSDGAVYIAEKDENGNIITDPSKMINAGVMSKNLGATRTKFDVVNEVKVGADRAASVLEVVRSKGVLTEEDARRNPEYLKARDNFVESLLTDKYNAASVLGDYLGGYSVTSNKDEAGGDKVYQDANGNIELTDEQVKVAREALTSEFETQVGKKQTPMPVFAPTSSDGGGGGGASDKSILTNVAALYYGDENQARSAASFIRGLSKNIIAVKRTPDGLTVRTKDGYETIPFKDSAGNMLTQEQFVEAAVNTLGLGIKDVKSAYVRSGVKDAPFNEVTNAASIFNLNPEAGDYVPTEDIEVLDKEGDTITFRELLSKGGEPDENDVSKINKALGTIDSKITVKASGDRFSTQDKISVFYDGVFQEDLNYDDPGDEEALINVIDRLRKRDSTPTPTPTPTTGAATGKSTLDASKRINQK